jgi:hypothetical protein
MWTDLLRGALLVLALVLLFKAQRFWFVRAWRLTGRVRAPLVRGALRGVWFTALAAVVWPLAVWMLGLPRSRYPFAILGMWLVSALFSWLGVQAVAGVERAWNWLRARFSNVGANRRARPVTFEPSVGRAHRSVPTHTHEQLANPSRRYLFQSTAVAVGIAPFAVSLYGYFGERLRYVVERVEIPIPDLPVALDGLRIVQLSDIHIGSYLPRQQVRRAVEMANELGAELAVVTGDFITGRGDPLEDCVEELAALRAPLGVWACNGNHEIYARCEARAADLFEQGGMRVLRQENAGIAHHGAALNLIGVDYQRTRAVDGPPMPMLAGVRGLVRRDAVNILLSHNPNAFPKAAELGIQLTLAGHTHGGQVQVEILDHRLSPARFMTDFVAGHYRRGDASLYVNRGIGTVGTPVRFGAPPEITLLTLRRA